MDIFYLADPIDRIENYGPGQVRVGDWSNRRNHAWLEREAISVDTHHKVFVYTEEEATEVLLSWSSKYQRGTRRVSFKNDLPEAGTTDEHKPWVVQLLAPEKNEWLRVLDPGTHNGRAHLSCELPRAMAVMREIGALPSKPTVRISNWVNGTYVLA